MKKKISSVLKVFLGMAFLGSCSAPTNEVDISELGSAIIRPNAGPGITMSKIVEPTSTDLLLIDKPQTGTVDLGPDFILHSTLEFNLDADEGVEQLIICKKRNDPADSIYIAVGDYQNDKGVWAVSWTTMTPATNLKTFSVSTLDITGQHDPSVVAQGITKDGLQSLSIYRFSPTTLGPVGEVLLQTTSNQEISIVQTERGAGYEEQGLPAPAFPVEVLERNPNSANSTDLIKTTYQWNQKLQRYAVVSSEALVDNERQEEALNQLFKSDLETVEAYMTGAWIRTDRSASALRQFVYFDSVQDELRLIEGDHLESFEWTSSHKIGSANRLMMYLINESLRSVRSTLSISMIDETTFSLAMQDRPEWVGTFQKLPDQPSPLFRTNGSYQVPLHPFVVSGLFKGDHGRELIFTGQNFTQRKDGVEKSGTWVSYKLQDSTILTLGTLSFQGTFSAIENYRVSLTEVGEGAKIVRTLSLEPVRLFVNAVASEGNEVLRYTQVESVE